MSTLKSSDCVKGAQIKAKEAVAAWTKCMAAMLGRTPLSWTASNSLMSDCGVSYVAVI